MGTSKTVVVSLEAKKSRCFKEDQPERIRIPIQTVRKPGLLILLRAVLVQCPADSASAYVCTV